MNRKELISQVLSALGEMEGGLEDGPTSLLLPCGGRRVLVRVEKAGDRLKLTTGRLFRRTVEVPLDPPCERGGWRASPRAGSITAEERKEWMGYGEKPYVRTAGTF